MEKSLPSGEKELSYPKKLFFYLFLFVFPFLLLLVIEVSLEIVSYGKDFSLFINHPDEAYSNYKIVNPEIGAKYFSNLPYTSPKNDLFLKNKDENSFRIFVMGSSTVVGFPYEQNLMFSRILESRLQKAYPGKHIEIVNTAITAINSFTLLDFMDDIIAERPDAILIYAGHNEYYGAFGIGSNEGIGKNRSLVMLHFKLMDYKTYQLIQNIVTRVAGIFKGSSKEAKRGTLMSRIVKKADIAWQSEDYKTGLEFYRKNMSAILSEATENNIPVFLSTLVSNIADNKPFGFVKLENGESANDFFEKALSAKISGDFIAAKEFYTKARDLDCVRFRASSDINNVIEELAKKHQAFLVPMLKVFEENSPHSLVGNNLITEHVHPNIDGYFLMADVFYTSLKESKLLGIETVESTSKSAVLFRNSYGYTSLDSLLGHHLIENLKYHWPFRDESKTYLDYRDIYKPINMIDSLAFSIMKTKNSSSVDAHLLLAKKYIAHKDFVMAGREYKAIIQIAPATPELLREAASFFISAGDLPLALECFTKSLIFEESYFAFFRAGEIFLIQNDHAKAAQYFTKAFKSAEEDYKVKILTKLYLSYVYMGKTNEANQVYQTIRQYQPAFKIQIPPVSYTFPSYIPVQIRDRVDKANDLIRLNKYDQALAILLSCLEINDSPAVNRMVGIIYSQKQDLELASIYLKNAYPWFKFEPMYLVFQIKVNLSCNKISEAKICLSQLRQIDPENPELVGLDRILNVQ